MKGQPSDYSPLILADQGLETAARMFSFPVFLEDQRQRRERMEAFSMAVRRSTQAQQKGRHEHLKLWRQFRRENPGVDA